MSAPTHLDIAEMLEFMKMTRDHPNELIYADYLSAALDVVILAHRQPHLSDRGIGHRNEHEPFTRDCDLCELLSRFEFSGVPS